jgi:hypothetical protein
MPLPSFSKAVGNASNPLENKPFRVVQPNGWSAGCSNSQDADLARVVEAWTTLPEPIRRALLALVGATGS